MSPITHLFASWLVAAKTTNNPRDCRLVTLAGIVPDADGLGLVLDLGGSALGHEQTWFYARYHHYLLHGWFGAALSTVVLACFARQRLRAAVLCLIVFHLHLLCDLIGSRGPSAVDLWPIFYFGPFSKDPMWLWKGQWPLDAWPNRLLSVVLFLWGLCVAVRRGDSFVGVFNRRVDSVFVGVLRGWKDALVRKRQTKQRNDRTPDPP